MSSDQILSNPVVINNISNSVNNGNGIVSWLFNASGVFAAQSAGIIKFPGPFASLVPTASTQIFNISFSITGGSVATAALTAGSVVVQAGTAENADFYGSAHSPILLAEAVHATVSTSVEAAFQAPVTALWTVYWVESAGGGAQAEVTVADTYSLSWFSSTG